MISAMRVRVSSRTNGDSLMTRETVFFETLASRAMSLIVCFLPAPRRNVAGRISAIGAAWISATARAGAGGGWRLTFFAGLRAILWVNLLWIWRGQHTLRATPDPGNG